MDEGIEISSTDENHVFMAKDFNGHQAEILVVLTDYEDEGDEDDDAPSFLGWAQCKTCEKHSHFASRPEEDGNTFINLIDTALQMHAAGFGMDSWEDELAFYEINDEEEDEDD